MAINTIAHGYFTSDMVVIIFNKGAKYEFKSNKKMSAWKFVTSSSGGLGIEFFAAEGGKIYLDDPTGSLKTFDYGVVGLGLSEGFKLPKIGKLQIPITR